MLHSIQEICSLTDHKRSEIYAMFNNGTMSYVVDKDGKRKVESSELIRAFPNLDSSLLLNKNSGTHFNQSKKQQLQSTKELQDMRHMIAELKEKIDEVLLDNRRLLRLLDYQTSKLEAAKNNSTNQQATDIARQGWREYQKIRQHETKSVKANIEPKEQHPQDHSTEANLIGTIWQSLKNFFLK